MSVISDTVPGSHFIFGFIGMPCNFAIQLPRLSRFLFFLATCFFLSLPALAQVGDTGVIPAADSIPDQPVAELPAFQPPQSDPDPAAADTVEPAQPQDSVSRMPMPYAHWQFIDSLPLVFQVLRGHPYYGFEAKPAVIRTGKRLFEGQEQFFYSMIGLLLGFAFLKEAFPKYINDLFRVLFRSTMKQKQIREQLMQTPFPSLLLNVFFAVSGGMYIDILLNHFRIAPVENFWLLFLYCAAGLAGIYSVKYAGLKISGWLFNVKEATDSYIFVVFLINKAIGIFLLPFIIALSFTRGEVFNIALALSYCGIGLLVVYRFLFAYASIRNQVRFNPFHFFLYICAFEIAPLLLIYKALLFFFE